jgi:predicted kinase
MKMTQRVLYLKGLPASGKTTRAKELVDKGWKRVNKDDLRAMLDGGKWSKASEKVILDIRDSIILNCLRSGHDVVVDDTNLHPKHIPHIEDLVQEYVQESGNFVVTDEEFIDTPLKECIKRDLQRPNPVGEKVIKGMFNSFLKEEPPTIEYNENLPNCIIVDIDGTLAHMNGRSPYDYSKVLTDSVDPLVREMVAKFRDDSYFDSPQTYVIIVSGRPDTCMDDTKIWLSTHQIKYDELHMRDHTRVDENGNHVKDTVIKKEIYDKWIKDRYNVRFVLDDRNSVVEMWRSLGLKVLQVAEGDF